MLVVVVVVVVMVHVASVQFPRIATLTLPPHLQCQIMRLPGTLMVHTNPNHLPPWANATIKDQKKKGIQLHVQVAWSGLVQLSGHVT